MQTYIKARALLSAYEVATAGKKSQTQFVTIDFRTGQLVSGDGKQILFTSEVKSINPCGVPVLFDVPLDHIKRVLKELRKLAKEDATIDMRTMEADDITIDGFVVPLIKRDEYNPIGSVCGSFVKSTADPEHPPLGVLQVPPLFLKCVQKVADIYKDEGVDMAGKQGSNAMVICLGAEHNWVVACQSQVRDRLSLTKELSV